MRPNVFVLLALCGGCAVDGPDDPATAEVADEVLGSSSTLDADCTGNMMFTFSAMYRYEKAALGTRAFEQCVEQAVRGGVETLPGQIDGPYAPCPTDPFATTSADWQIQQVLSVARTLNSQRMTCTGLAVGDAAPVQIRDYDTTDPEWIVWGSLLTNLTRNGVPGGPELRLLAGADLRATIGVHGYHDASCYPPTSGFGARNTMPQIVGNCLRATLDNGAVFPDTCGGGTGRLIQTRYDGGVLACATDPSLAPVTELANAQTHVTTSANTVQGMTVLPAMPDPNLGRAQFLHVIRGASTGPSYIGPNAYAYHDATGTQPWEIFTPGANIPFGTAFFARYGRGFVHTSASTDPMNPYISVIDNPLANNNPNAYLQVSPLAGYNMNPHPIGVYYDTVLAKWAVFNEDFAPIPYAASFAVSVETPANPGVAFLHIVSTTNRNGTGGTRLSSPLLDNNPNARFLVTRNWSRGPAFDQQTFGAWFDGTYWWINSETAAGPGASFPLGLAFNIEILRDEVHRFVQVPESATDVDTGIDVTGGDYITIRAIQHIKPTAASAWVAPWGDLLNPGPGYPLPNASRGELLGRFSFSGAFEAGTLVTRFGPPPVWTRYGTIYSQRLSLLTNDNVRGDGSGFFTAEIRVLR